jgi:hypothetical protein
VVAIRFIPWYYGDVEATSHSYFLQHIPYTNAKVLMNQKYHKHKKSQEGSSRTTKLAIIAKPILSFPFRFWALLIARSKLTLRHNQSSSMDRQCLWVDPGWYVAIVEHGFYSMDCSRSRTVSNQATRCMNSKGQRVRMSQVDNGREFALGRMIVQWWLG